MDVIRRIALFGMTGQGNNALSVLSNYPGIELVALFTPVRPDNSFPHYKCEQIADAARQKKIPVYEGLLLRSKETQEIIKSLDLDLIIVSSFDQIVPVEVIRIPRYGVVNVHPSILPRWRGRIPTVSALIAGDKHTGITAHFIEEKIDSGRVITQIHQAIYPEDDDGTLRYRLAKISEIAIRTVLEKVFIQSKDSFPEQEGKETRCFKREDILRAITPYPLRFK